ncbi:hypothetical protein RND81_09G059400 [Saponaria officinalis]|uniref:Uncharacterized protein n=1 Tax=Saponaria officinalis TaxID=3572 RepID=A0AAW1IH88_SAPOF
MLSFCLIFSSMISILGEFIWSCTFQEVYEHILSLWAIRVLVVFVFIGITLASVISYSCFCFVMPICPIHVLLRNFLFYLFDLLKIYSDISNTIFDRLKRIYPF